MGFFRWLSPEMGIGAVLLIVVVMLVFMFLKRGMGGGPRGMGRWNRMGGYGPTDVTSRTEGRQQSNVCPSCQASVQPDWKLCPHCGKELA